MSRSKAANYRRLSAALIGLLLPGMLLCGCGSTDAAETTADIYVGRESDGEASYVTDTVRQGDFAKTSSFDGTLFYPETEELVYEGDRAIFSEWLVAQGDEVKEGDTVAILSVEYDAVALEEMEWRLTQSQSEYEWQMELLEEAVTAQRERAEASEGSERERALLEQKKAQKQLELYQLTAQAGLLAQKKAIEEFEQAIAADELKAPMDGIVSELSYRKEGDSVQAGDTLMVVYNPNVVWMQVTDPSASLRYNGEVTIETGNAKSRTVLHGRVVSADNILPDALRRGAAYVEINDMPERVNWMNTSVKAELITMKQVLLVNRQAVESSDGSSFVYILEDGKLHRRQVVRAGQGTDACWILMGLTEGQEVVISQ